MSEEINNQTEQPIPTPAATEQPLSLEQENNRMLKEILRNVKWVRRVYTTSLIITVTLLVLPMIAAAIVLPRFIRTITDVYGQFGSESGLAPSGNMFDLLKELQEAQKQLNQNSSQQTQ